MKPDRKRRILGLIKYGLLTVFIYFIFLNTNFLWLFGSTPGFRDLRHPPLVNPSEVYTADSVLIGKFIKQDRSPVTYEELSPTLINALIATEDRRFFKHPGVDPLSLVSSIWSSLSGNPRGGSTITQQLAKNLYDTRNNKSVGLLGHVPLIRTLVYKTKEWLTAIKLELLYSKEEILSLYLNTVSFGNNSFGIKIASDRYFSKPVNELAPEEAAVLVGMLKATSTYNPVSNPENSILRRNVVLSQMRKYHYISAGDYQQLVKKPLELKLAGDREDQMDSYIPAAVRRRLSSWADSNQVDLYADGLKIYTTINSNMQLHAEEAVREQMKILQKRFRDHWGNRAPWTGPEGKEITGFIESKVSRLPEYQSLMEKFKGDKDTVMAILSRPRKMTVFSWDGETAVEMSTLDSLAYYAGILHAGLVTVEPATGHIKAWVGGIDEHYFKYDHVDQSKRQPGSTFKPFVYLTALEQGYSPCDEFIDRPVTIRYEENGEQRTWSPQNSDWVFTGYRMSLRWALAKSCNSITAQLTEKVGWKNVARYARRLGIRSPLSAVPSIGLGTSDVSLYELVNAYGVFLNRGRRNTPLLISHIADLEGNTLARFRSESQRVIEDESAWLMLYMLLGSMEEPGGTSQSLWEYDLWKNGNQIGGKTGTTSDYSDGWYIGVTKDLVTGVWVGASDRRVHFRNSRNGEGSKTALPVFGKYMEKVYRDPRTDVTLGKFPDPWVAITKQYQCPSRVPEPANTDNNLLEKLEKTLDSIFN